MRAAASLSLGLLLKQAKDLLRFRVTVQRKARVRHDTELTPNEIVTIVVRKRVRDDALEHHGLKIIHLDDAVVVVDKPTGLLSMGSDREKERTAHRLLNEYLKMLTRSRLQQALIVHRLDRETSGLMVFARNQSTQSSLQQNWKNVTKRYLAVVEGVPASGQERSKTILWKTIHSWFIVSIRGASWRSHYRVLRRHGDKSLLEISLETGRKNQILVQLAALGHPIIGDRKYGASTDSARRLSLHACELTFRHPISGASIEFHSDLPTQMKQLFETRVAHARNE
jgi:23S rRNA pseudouridine1911/1915/1917 synthase